ncbi:MAG: hypothetical protein ACOYK9_00200 [Chlamydiia bacterium]
MTQRNISGSSYHNLQNEINIEHTAKDKYQKDQERDLPPGGFNLLILSYKGAQTLLQIIRSIDSLRTPQRVIDSLREFLAIFKKLESVDLSADWRYCEKLSKSWMEVKESLSEGSFPTISLQELVQSIEHYPEKGDHSLGYYLSLHAGEEWIPFPFMEILRNLHENKPEIEKLLKKGEIALRSLV